METILKLREVREEDILILHHWINEREIIRSTNSYRPISSIEQKAWFNNIDYFKNNFVFIIELLNEKKVIGTCGLYDPDFIARKAELRIKIFEQNMRGKGYGKMAMNQLISFGFNDANLNRIWLKVLDNNKSAISLYKKVGFEKEGILKKDMFITGIYHDVVVMGLLNTKND